MFHARGQSYALKFVASLGIGPCQHTLMSLETVVPKGLSVY